MYVGLQRSIKHGLQQATTEISDFLSNTEKKIEKKNQMNKKTTTPLKYSNSN